MQNFVNNWSAEVTLSPGATSLAVSLPDGTYRLTLSDALGQAATRWEIIEAVVAAGIATLTRGIEGTGAQDWPDGSVAYVAVTAGFLESVQGGSVALPRLPVGQFFCPLDHITSTLQSEYYAGWAYLHPFWVDAPTSVDQIGTVISTPIDATLDMAVYTADADGWPSARLAVGSVTGSLANRVAGPLDAPAQLLPGQRYWIAIKSNVAIRLKYVLVRSVAVVDSDLIKGLQRSLGVNPLPLSWGGFVASDLSNRDPALMVLRRSA